MRNTLHGRMDGERFRFENGTPVKFWGVNLSYGGNRAPEKKDGEFTAARFARYGINGVRGHKFAYPKDATGIGDVNDATRMDPEGLDRLDAFAAEFKKNMGLLVRVLITADLKRRPTRDQSSAPRALRRPARGAAPPWPGRSGRAPSLLIHENDVVWRMHRVPWR